MNPTSNIVHTSMQVSVHPSLQVQSRSMPGCRLTKTTQTTTSQLLQTTLQRKSSIRHAIERTALRFQPSVSASAHFQKDLPGRETLFLPASLLLEVLSTGAAW